MRVLAATEHELDFWVRHVKVGVRLTYATAVVSWAYFALTWGRPNRPAMTVLVAATAMMSTVVARLPLRRILSDRRGIWLFYAWSTGVVGFVTALTVLDGGPSSPASVIYSLALIYAAMAYPPRGMVWLGGLVAGTIFLLQGVDKPFDAGAAFFMSGAYLLVTAMCTLTARNFWSQLHRQTELTAELDALVHVDSLTGCLNHRAFHERLRAAVDEAVLVERPLSLAVADLDHFKFVNDLLGHPEGDAVLQQVGYALRRCARETDIVARIGGEEFALLMPDTTLDEAGALAERVRAEVGGLDGPVPITISVGVSSLPSPATSLEALLEQADAGVYAAKRSRRDPVVVQGRSALEAPTDANEEVRSRVERVIVEGRVRARFQPVVSMADGGVLGYEALARVEGSNLAPDRWLDLAERAGLRGDLEAAMWDAALADGWTGEGLLFLNASPVALLTGALWRCRHRVPAGVVIEVSEQHAIADYSALSRTLSDWAGFGAQVAVDDMGSGHANLRHVLNLAPRFLKLDRSLVADLHVTPARYALVESIARFAERTGSLVIAEGIETEEEAEAVRAAGVPYGQGYLFARPEPVPPTVHWRPAEALLVS